MSVVGVDFGNKNVLIAAAGRGGVDVVLNGNSQRLNPCMVGFDQARSMGESASATASSNFRNTIHSMKRLVGLTFNDPAAQKEMSRLPFKCVPLPHASGPPSVGVTVSMNGDEKTFSIESVAGMMVKHMGSIAASKSAQSASAESKVAGTGVTSPLFPQDWVIAVPGYYTDAQKRAFLAGCEVVGIPGVLRLMHESTATALAYGIFKDIKKEFTKDTQTHVMFIDIGATAYSVSIVAFEPGKLIVKSTQFDKDLGGRDFDWLIASWFAEKFEEKYKGKLSSKPMSKPKVVIKLLSAAEKAKKTLSPFGVKEVRMNVECLMDELDFGCSLSAMEYEKMCEPLLARLEAPIQRALAEVGLTAKDLTSVEIVGGSTRIGSVKRQLARILELDASATNNGLSTTMNADEAVARGAALQSAILSPRFKVLPYEIIEYQPYPIKIAWDGESTNNSNSEQGVEVEGEAEGISSMPTNSVVMFERGSNFPCVRRVALRRSGKFSVTASYDDAALEHSFPADAHREIATFQISAPAPSENKIRVNVKQDIHGMITLSSAQMVEELVEEEPEQGAGESKEKESEETKKEPSEPPKKKKIKKTNLEFTISRPLEWTKVERDAAYEAEVQMDNNDRIVRETADMRNELESYLYDMRDQIVSESRLQPFCTDQEREVFSKALEDTENWLYEDGFDAPKSVYAEKLAEVKKMGDPIVFRYRESTTRNTAVSSLQRNIEKYKNWVQSAQADEKYAHITEEEISTCYSKCDDISSWLYDMLDKQGGLPANVNPAFTCQDVQNKNKELTAVINPIMNKPKPKPKKEEKKKDEEAKKEEGTDEKASGDEPQPMDTSEEAAKEEEKAEPMDTQ
eukprot:CAMPEP_0172487582 /NCGR_PEP_ID=MMETSP1066-20121228/16713_1 /TAXON_ID=671091 /ORGANISM="Coscinodiscus wailesii, Strain CCMP2513" /LENGTH=853 /DNA_ID=CAMNT_0013254283 /DNA_START=120 /DNA_END=2681 /DNA_ORIENTATION=-